MSQSAAKKQPPPPGACPSPLYWGVGDLSLILDGQGAPAAVMRTLSFVKCKFKDVEEGLALAEAEGVYEE